MAITPERFRSGMSVHTSRAIDALKDGKPGDVVSLERMEEIVGRPCGNYTAGRGNVGSAIKHVLRRFKAAWEWDRNAKGWRCLSSADKLEVMPRRVRRARGQLRNGLMVISTANMDELTAEQQKVLRAQSVHAGTLLLFSNPKAIEKLEKAGFEIKKPDMRKVIELMKKK